MQTNIYTQEIWRLRAWVDYVKDEIRKQENRIKNLELAIEALRQEINLLKLNNEEWQTTSSKKSKK